MYSRSVISPVVIRGMLALAVSGGSMVWPGFGCPPATTVVTVIEADAWLLVLVLPTASLASTVYVWLEPAVSPVSVNDVVVDDPTEVAPPSR